MSFYGHIGIGNGNIVKDLKIVNSSDFENEVENSKLNILIKTSDRLMRVANKNIVSMVLSELDEEDRKDIDISEYLSCYSRVRTG